MKISRQRIYSYSNIALAVLVFALTVFCIRYKAETSAKRIYQAHLEKKWYALKNESYNYSSLYTICPLSIPMKMYYGEACERLGDSNGAIEYFKSAIKSNPNHPFVWTNLGTTYSTTGQYTKSVESLKKAVDLAPTYPIALSNLGFSCGRLNQIDKAIEYTQRAIDAKPDYENAKQNLKIFQTQKVQNLLAFINKYGWGPI